MKIKIDPLDTLFSEYVRRRAMKEVGGCERCLTPQHDTQKENGDIFPAWQHLDCSHFFGRARKSTRWDTDNAAGLCAGCHMYLGSHPLEHVEWFKQRLGEGTFAFLQSRMRTPARHIDKQAITLYLKLKIKELSNE